MSDQIHKTVDEYIESIPQNPDPSPNDIQNHADHIAFLRAFEKFARSGLVLEDDSSPLVRQSYEETLTAYVRTISEKTTELLGSFPIALRAIHTLNEAAASMKALEN